MNKKKVYRILSGGQTVVEQFKKENRSINRINSLECFDHDKELKELDILFNKIENDN